MGITTRNYSELRNLESFEARFDFLSIRAKVGVETFGFERWMNQVFYTSKEWRDLRYEIIVRDQNCDLGVPGFEIYDRPIIHHIIPIAPEDFETGNPLMLDPENLITTTLITHNAIHFGDKSVLKLPPKERTPGDTKLW